MEVSQGLLGLLFVLSVATGAGMGVLWSLIRFLRGLCPSRGSGRYAVPVLILLTFADILFGTLGGIAVILLLYYVNDGQFRLLAVLGIGCGFFAWYYTLGALLGRLTDWLSETLRNALRRLVEPVAHGMKGLAHRVAGELHSLAARRRREGKPEGESVENDEGECLSKTDSVV